MKKHPYYSYNKVDSFNATYNLLLGGRGIGKSYGAKKKVIRAAINKGDQFILLRRFKTELMTARNTFFADIAKEFPKYDFRVEGSKAQMSPVIDRETKKREWKDIGLFIALTQAQNFKGSSFPNVKTIIFDEFVIEKGANHYLPDESVIFNNFYSTVDRYQDKTKVYFLANSVSIMNPYFLQWKIQPQEDNDLIVAFKGFVVCHIIDSTDFNASVYKTKFGMFIEGTEYAEYAVENKFLDNNDAMLQPKDSKARYIFSLETKSGVFSVWMNFFTSDYYVQGKLPKTQEIFTLLSDKMDVHKTLMTVNDLPIGRLRTAYRKGRISFDSPSTRNIFADIFKR